MRKIIVGAQVSLDGVMQSPGGPTEDPTKGFKFGGWSMPYFDQAGGEEIMSLFKDKFDLLLGSGKKLFADGSAPHSFKLTKSRVTPTGLMVGHYEREGKVKTDDTALGSPSEREIARRERMKREG